MSYLLHLIKHLLTKLVLTVLSNKGNVLDDGDDFANDDLSDIEDNDDLGQEGVDGAEAGLVKGLLGGHLPPISSIEEIFAEIAKVAVANGFGEALNHLNGRKLRIGTMCSGTESPILAMTLFSHALEKLGLDFKFKHLMSAEIVPFKQAYIQRNFPGPAIFRDVRELGRDGKNEATTAYGGKSLVPDDLDMLVAGFACVDFSMLNTRKKDLSDEGESGDTFWSIIRYAKKFRPKIIIIENVYFAPWEKIEQNHFPEIQYAARWVRVDTKNYYIPQTRRRGYMICVDRLVFPEPEELLEKWAHAVTKVFSRQASSSIEDFMLEEDDPRLLRARLELAKGEERNREVDWERCYARHVKERRRVGVGKKRPMTNWHDGGESNPFDFMWLDWLKGQVPRVLDTIDINFLRDVVVNGFDNTYKMRVINLSQNVDRSIGSTRLGLTECLTPSGLPYSTIRGGPLTGLEALVAQGLPLDKLSLTRETQAQLKDLAGNAMTSTVIGICMIAAVQAAFSGLTPGSPTKKGSHMQINALDHISGTDLLVHRKLDLTQYNPISVTSAKQIARKGIRLCLCEGRTAITTNELQICKACGNTSCSNCGMRPVHDYERLSKNMLSDRCDPRIIEEALKAALPMSFALGCDSQDDIAGLRDQSGLLFSDEDETDWALIAPSINCAFTATLHFQHVKRTEHWQVRYESETAWAELIIDGDNLEWRLYGKATPPTPALCRLRELLQQPIARMHPTGDDIIRGNWQWRIIHDRRIIAEIIPSGPLVPSWKNALGIVKSAELKCWSQLNLIVPESFNGHLDRNISGKYTWLPNCGKASGSLHKQEQKIYNQPPLYFFLDPNRVGLPDEDFFIFSTDIRRLDRGESRQYTARTATSWRPPTVEKCITDGKLSYKIESSGSTREHSSLGNIAFPIEIIVDGCWGSLPGTHIELREAAPGASYHFAPPDFKIDFSGDTSCNNAHTILAIDATITNLTLSQLTSDHWQEIDELSRTKFFKPLASLTEKIRVLPGLENWRQVFSGHKLVKTEFPQCAHTCAPTPAKMLWCVDSKGKLQPYEDPEEAAKFEHAVKNRPSPFVTLGHIDDFGRVKLRIAINPQTLLHRSDMLLCGNPQHSEIERSWRLVSDYNPPTKPHMPPFVVKNNANDPEASTPADFLYRLRSDQSKALVWMVAQESVNAEPFVEEEVEESSINQLGLRLEARSSRKVKVLSGISADHVGFGKTVTTLALIATQYENDRLMNKVAHTEGRISIKATLILVPPHLPLQWNNELKKFLGVTKKYKVLVIKTALQLQKLTIKDFTNADIIISSWNVFEGASYAWLVAQFAGMVELPDNSSSRAKNEWYEYALKSIKCHVEELKKGGTGLEAMISDQLTKNENEAFDVNAVIPSKRLRGAAYQKAKTLVSKPTRKRKHAEAESEEDTKEEEDDNQNIPGPNSTRKVDKADDEKLAEDPSKNARARKMTQATKLQNPQKVFSLQTMVAKGTFEAMTCPLLEIFAFSRVVFDEYTYIVGETSSVLQNLHARSRWALSATPPLRDFADIKRVAGFVGFSLGRDDCSLGVTKKDNVRKLTDKMTKSEEFRSFNQSFSAAWHEDRWARAQLFLSRAMRKNLLNVKDLPGTEQWIVVQLPALEYALYLELQQVVASPNSPFKKGKSSLENDQMKRNREYLGASGSAGEALLKCATTVSGDGVDDASEACKAIISLRKLQRSKIVFSIRGKLRQAECLLAMCIQDKCEEYEDWKRSIGSNEIGDRECRVETLKLIRKAEKEKSAHHWPEFYASQEEIDQREISLKLTKVKVTRAKKAKTTSKGITNDRIDNDGENKAEEEDALGIDTRPLLPSGMVAKKERTITALRNATNDLNKLCRELVARNRGLRFFSRIQSMQLGSNTTCDLCGQSGFCPEEVSILSICGHLFCNLCLLNNTWDECLERGCDAQVREYHLVRGNRLHDKNNITAANDSRQVVEGCCSRKVQMIVELILNIDAEDQVLLFVQFQDVIRKISSAFEKNNITYMTLDNGDPADSLRTFQEGENKTKGRKKVLILTIGDVSAAGSNLTMANHVIFASPFLATNPEHYEATMIQAVGRARRFGQTKHVYTYRFVTAGTVDVDIVQFRSGKILDVGCGEVEGAPGLRDRSTADVYGDSRGKFGTIVGENLVRSWEF